MWFGGFVHVQIHYRDPIPRSSSSIIIAPAPAADRTGAAIASVQTDSDVDKVGLGFYTSGSSASTQTMTQKVLINHLGNVGIGISSGMTYPLTIHDNNSSNSYVHFVNSTTGTAFGDGSQIGVPSGGTDLLILNRESANIKMYTGGSERLRIDSSAAGS